MNFWDTVLSEIGQQRTTQDWVAEKTGVAYSTFNGWIRRGVLPPVDKAVKIAEALGVPLAKLTGENYPFVDLGISDYPPQGSGKPVGVPYFDVEASAHITDMANQEHPNPEFYVDFQPFNDCSAYLPIFGESMFPMIRSGDVVAVKQITNLNVIQWGEPYLVVTNGESNDLRTVKLVFEADEKDSLVLRASNPNFKGDMVVTKASILGMYLVKGIVTRRQM